MVACLSNHTESGLQGSKLRASLLLKRPGVCVCIGVRGLLETSLSSFLPQGSKGLQIPLRQPKTCVAACNWARIKYENGGL